MLIFHKTGKTSLWVQFSQKSQKNVFLKHMPLLFLKFDDTDFMQKIRKFPRAVLELHKQTNGQMIFHTTFVS